MTRAPSVYPLFVFGIARSGTNLIAGMLNSHGSIVLGLDPLMPFFKALRKAVVWELAPKAVAARFDPLSPFQDYYFDSHGPVLLDTTMAGSLDLPVDTATREELVAAVSSRAALESPRLGERLLGLTGNTFRKLCDDVLVKIAKAKKEENLAWAGTKEVWTAEFIPVLAKAYPHARFIMTLRDPRAVVASLAAQAALDPTQAAHSVSYLRHWRKQVSLYSAFQEDRSLAARIRLQRYESLVVHPEDEARALCDFLDVAYEPKMSQPTAPDGGPFIGNSSYGGLSGISSAPAEHWRETISPAARKAVEFHCGPEMIISAYPLEQDHPGTLDDAIWQYVREAHSAPGSWRSDGSNPERDTMAERYRWEILEKPALRRSTDTIRRHFLFESSYRRISKSFESDFRIVHV